MCVGLSTNEFCVFYLSQQQSFRWHENGALDVISIESEPSNRVVINSLIKNGRFDRIKLFVYS